MRREVAGVFESPAEVLDPAVVAGPPAAGSRAWGLLLATHADLMRAMTAELESATGLSMVFFDVLNHVVAAGPDGVRMTDLERRVFLSQSGVSRVVQRLEAAGFSDRRRDDADGRAWMICATAAGCAAYEQARLVHERTVSRLFVEVLEPGEAACIVAGLSRVRAAISSDR